MYKRIIVIAFLLLSFMCLSVNGQTSIVYSYDSAGNRTSRTTVEATNVASVSSEMSIDANDRLKCSLPVSNDIGNIVSLTSGEVATSMFTGINPITGKQIWPKNFGFNAGSVEDYVIQEGDFIDRYGDTNGRFMSPDGTPFDLRGLPKSYEGKTYTRYVVNKPIPVTKGIASPVNWFTSAGGGTQYYLSHSVQYYIDNGYISVVK